MNALEVHHISKAYRQFSSGWRRVASWFESSITPTEEYWVLRDINFSVAPGEAVGIIGQNGAGKSTLLKLITGTLTPTKGHVSVVGRVAAILELGIGFNPEFTGRQNAYNATRLMGFSTTEISRVMSGIEAFAEIGDYFDKPVRTYSSGMQVRVAFAVATAFRPEILIVDEALSVGDAYFQHKSLARIREFQKLGTTLLFVSHDRTSVLSICDRAILLSNGRIEKEGQPEAVIDYYNALVAKKKTDAIQQTVISPGRVQTRSGTGEASIISIKLLSDMNEEIETVSVGARIVLEIAVKVYEDIPRLVLGFSIRDRLGLSIYGTNTHFLNKAIENPKKDDLYRYRFSFPLNIGPGSYSVATALVSTQDRLTNSYECRELALLFQVINLHHPIFAGYAWLDAKLEEISSV